LRQPLSGRRSSEARSGALMPVSASGNRLVMGLSSADPHP
jgi:hypothetical protein